MVSVSKPKASGSYPPGPKGDFFFGILPEYSRGPLGFLSKSAKEYGDVVYWKVAWFSAYQLNHPDYIQEVLVSKSNLFHKNRSLQLFRRIFGQGLVSSEGEFWQRQRRLMQPAFYRERIFAYGEVIVDYAQKLLATWQDGETRDVHEEMMALTLEVVAKTLFEADVEQQVKTIGTALQESIEYFEARNNNLFLFLLPEWFPTTKNLRFLRAVKQLDEIVYTLIRQRRLSGEDKGDLLSMLLQVQDEDGIGMSDQQVRDEVMTLFIAGHETTALTMSWTFYLLSQYPEVEAKLVQELQSVLGGRMPTLADLPQLRYTEWVVMESMRLYPPVWALGRTVMQDCEIAGYRLHAGDSIIVSQWVMHRDPRYFDDPEVFQPERWQGDFAKKLPTFAYFPFGGGPRICIGKSFAMMEAVLLLASIAQKFRLTLVPDQDIVPWPAFTLRPKYGIKMVLAERF
jgi:cytochrome P450